ncbi:MAG: hypothetical protein ACLGH0_02865, partial [Thermoanaerobaculia bacterium]
SLYTAFVRDDKTGDAALVHVLFVPDVDPPTGASGSSGTVGWPRFQYTYNDYARNQQLESPEITIVDQKFVQGAGRIFALDLGNVFVVQFGTDVSRMTQIREIVRDPKVAVLPLIKQRLPNERRVQMIPLRSS